MYHGDNMHKMVIGFIVILVNIAFAPCINADVEIDKYILIMIMKTLIV